MSLFSVLQKYLLSYFSKIFIDRKLLDPTPRGARFQLSSEFCMAAMLLLLVTVN
jgi:hypothetical protein